MIVLGLDQGTSSTRCVALDRELRELGAASVPLACSFPGPGLVEQDPEAIAESARAAIAGALAQAGRDDVAALGIANQTETFVVWDRATGRAVHPAIVWQDRRTADACAALREHARLVRERTGLELDATFPATKLRWVLDRTDGDLAYGDVGSWLLHRLAGVHLTDAGNAARSLLCPLGGTDWDDDLLALFGVPRSIMPPIVDTDAIAARIDAGPPVRAVVGDQQASLFGLRCWSAGQAKVTLGTGAFVLANAGHEPPAPPDGVLASTAWRARRADDVRARGLRADGRRRARLVRPHRRAARRAGARRAAARPPPTTPAWSACPRSRASARRAGTPRPAARCSASSSAPPAPTSRARSSTACCTRSPTRSTLLRARARPPRRRPRPLGLDRPAPRRPGRRPRRAHLAPGLDRDRRRHARGARRRGVGVAGGAAGDRRRPGRRAGDGAGRAGGAARAVGRRRGSARRAWRTAAGEESQERTRSARQGCFTFLKQNLSFVTHPRATSPIGPASLNARVQAPATLAAQAARNPGRSERST